ncbi:helix-turn-helix transcriptional regulator [Actinocorallia aurantiaca]|uniref:Helix-turn-helix transcriptional regulator n=1 Tax=Actinocorallia aurantiaca TaxID=46204 RepID=A0ABN3UVD4_9ACTN
MSHASYESDPDALRAHFAIELRRQRTRAGLSMNGLAKALGCTAQWISQLEQTEKPVPEQTAFDLDTCFKTEGWEENDGLFIRVYRAIQRAGRRRVLHQGFGEFLRHEAKSIGIRGFAAQIVPGLLQLEDYARALMDPAELSETLDARVAGRMERQSIFTRDLPPKALYVLDESVFRRPVGGPKVMAAQIDHLIGMAQSPQVQIRILPFDRITPVALIGGFILLSFEREPELMYIESASFSQLVDSREVLFNAGVDFNTMMGEALSQADSIAFMSRIREEYM